MSFMEVVWLVGFGLWIIGQVLMELDYDQKFWSTRRRE